MKHLLSALLILITLNVFAQKEHFQVIDAATHAPIYGVKIKSFLTKDLVTFSNDSGYFNINANHNDTLSISKDYYHTMYVTINMKNFDSLHTIVLIMAPSKQKDNQVLSANLGGLQYFEYQFSHTDPEQNSDLRFKVYEPEAAIDVRKRLSESHEDFRFATVYLAQIKLRPKKDYPLNYYHQEHAAPRK